MSEFNRRALYKNNDRDFESQRRNRNDHSVEIRKAKKDDQLQKRRNIDIEDFSESDLVLENTQQVKELLINDIPKMLASKNMTQMVEAATSCRKQLSKLKNPPIEEFYKNGTIPLLVKIMSTYNDDLLIFESAWALTNIASGESKHTAAVVEAGAVDVFVRLMSHQSEQIAEQSIWALSNIAGDSSKYRDMIINKDIINVVKNSVIRFWSKYEILRHVCWLISNLFRHKSKNYPTKCVIDMLPIIRELMTKIGDIPCIVDLTWALTYASDNRDEIIDAMIDTQLLDIIINNLSKETEVLTPSLRAIGNIIAGTNEQADAAIKCGVIHAVGGLLNHSLLRIVKESCWIISNISAGTVNQVDELVNNGIILSVLEVLKIGDYKSQKEAVWVISNMISSPKSEHRFYLLNNNVFSCIVPLLTCDDNKIVLLLLDAIKDLFVCADNNNQLEECINAFEMVGGVDVIENLQNHESVEIYDKSYEILRDYLGADENEENEEANEAVEQFKF